MKGGKVNNVTEFNHGMARGLMLAIAMLQDDLHDFQKLIKIEDGLPLRPLHADAYNEIFAAKKKLERARQILVKASVVTLTILALILIASMQAQSVAGGVAVVTPTITPTPFYVYLPFVSSDCNRICAGRDCYCALDQR